MGSYLSLCDLSNVVKSGFAGKRSCAVVVLCCEGEIYCRIVHRNGRRRVFDWIRHGSFCCRYGSMVPGAVHLKKVFDKDIKMKGLFV